MTRNQYIVSFFFFFFFFGVFFLGGGGEGLTVMYIWYASSEEVSYGICKQGRLRPACASKQSYFGAVTCTEMWTINEGILLLLLLTHL